MLNAMFGKYFLLVTLGLTVACGAHPAALQAQEESFQCASGTAAVPGAEAATLLEEVQKRYAKLKSLRAKFVQHEIIPGLGSGKQRSGVLYYAVPQMMKWDYATPEKEKMVYLIDHNMFWQYDVEQKTVAIYELDKVVVTHLSISFLMGLGNLSQDFLIERACKRQGGVVFYLKPKAEEHPDPESEDEMQGIRLLVDGKSYYPLGIYVEQLGNITAVFLRDNEYDPKLDAGVFEAKIPRGWDKDDHRKKEIR